MSKLSMVVILSCILIYMFLHDPIDIYNFIISTIWLAIKLICLIGALGVIIKAWKEVYG